MVASVIVVGACSANGQAEPCATGQCVPIPSGEITLAAEIDLPPGPGPHPLLIMIHGSGPGTRQDFAAVVDTYRSIGIGILRYDKRGSGESTGRFRDVAAANSIEVFDLLASDVLALVEYLATQPSVDADRIGLIGVSQAGWIMPSLLHDPTASPTSSASRGLPVPSEYPITTTGSQKIISATPRSPRHSHRSAAPAATTRNPTSNR